MSGGGDSKSSSVAEPPEETKPYLKPYLETAETLATRPYQEYGGQTAAGMNQNQIDAFGSTRDRAMAGSPQQGMANVNSYKTLRGDFLNPASNPYLSATYDAAAGDMSRTFQNSAMPSINSTFSQAGRYGSGAHQNAVGDAARTLSSGLSNLGTQIYGQNYGQERNNMMQAMSGAPGLAQADYQDASMLMGAGDAQRAYEQQNITDAYTRWQQGQQAPYQNLDVMGNAIMTTMGAGGKTTMYGPSGSNLGQLAGAGVAGLGLLG